MGNTVLSGSTESFSINLALCGHIARLHHYAGWRAALQGPNGSSRLGDTAIENASPAGVVLHRAIFDRRARIVEQWRVR